MEATEPRVPFGKVEVITSKILRSPPWLGWPLWNICVTNDHGYVPLVVNTSRSFPHSRLITGFVTRLTRRVPLVEQELFTFPEHLSSSPIFSGVCVTRSLVLYVCFVDRCIYLTLSILYRNTEFLPSDTKHYIIYVCDARCTLIYSTFWRHYLRIKENL